MAAKCFYYKYRFIPDLEYLVKSTYRYCSLHQIHFMPLYFHIANSFQRHRETVFSHGPWFYVSCRGLVTVNSAALQDNSICSVTIIWLPFSRQSNRERGSSHYSQGTDDISTRNKLQPNCVYILYTTGVPYTRTKAKFTNKNPNTILI